ncbi:MAG: hypothetical protein ACREXW_15625 [Gammaproteobacteria bacterium]
MPIRDVWDTGIPLRNDRFKEQMEAMLGPKAGQARRGRPKRGRKGPIKGSDPFTLRAVHAGY